MGRSKITHNPNIDIGFVFSGVNTCFVNIADIFQAREVEAELLYCDPIHTCCIMPRTWLLCLNYH